MSLWWLICGFVLVAFLIGPGGHGAGLRRWGVPYPSYVQQRLARRAVASGDLTADHEAWGRAGDLVWLGLIIAGIWAFVANVVLT